MKSKINPPPIDFEKLKEFIITADKLSLEAIFNSEDREDEAMFLFWALDFLHQRKENIPEPMLNNYLKNQKILQTHQKKIMNQKLKDSLAEYSSGFVLGALEVAIREREAMIETYSEYQLLVKKMVKWQEIGFPNEKFEKQWEQRMNSVKEIETWMNDRAEAYFPIISAIILSQKYQKTPRVVLKTLRKGGRSDSIVFQILAGILHSNPILNQRIADLCDKEKIEKTQIRTKFLETLHLLSLDSSETEIKKYCRLLLPALS